MHYTGTIWRPPYEANSLLIEATAGCTHHRCKFCTLYDDLPFKFQAASWEDIESDLVEAQMLRFDPTATATRRLLSKPRVEPFRRVFLTGANPFVLPTKRLLRIAELVHTHLPSVETIGCFARVTDSVRKSDGELQELRDAGFTGLTIGVETGNDEALAFMNKGYASQDILAQCRRLDEAGIEYAFFYLAGISGKGRGDEGAKASAAVFNQLHPFLIGANMLTVFPESQLYAEIERGTWRQAGEQEKYREMKTLVEQLRIPVRFAAMGASNAVQLSGRLPEDKEQLIATLDRIIAISEDELRRYRATLPHL